MIADFIVHYSRGVPFLSISSVPKERVHTVLHGLNETNAWGLGRFADPQYLDRRLKVERKLREAFVAKGGKPVLAHPIYFFLGRNAEFEQSQRNVGYRIRLKDLPRDCVSFTCGDSMFCFDQSYRMQKGGPYLNDLCAHVYKYDELYRVVSPLHIEAQLWIAPTDAMLSIYD